MRDKHIVDFPLADFPRTVTREMEEWKRKIRESQTTCSDRWHHFLKMWNI